MDSTPRNDIFEPGDLTALICIDQPELQSLVVDQLSSIDYKIHVGLYHDDISLKLRSFAYNVVVIDENFASTDISTNPVLYEAIHLPTTQRRLQYMVLIGRSLQTNDEMIAFIYSVDLVFNVADLANLKPVLRRGVARHREFYQSFNDVLKTAGM